MAIYIQSQLENSVRNLGYTSNSVNAATNQPRDLYNTASKLNYGGKISKKIMFGLRIKNKIVLRGLVGQQLLAHRETILA